MPNRFALRHGLPEALHIAQSAQGVGAAQGNFIGDLAFRGISRLAPRHLLIDHPVVVGVHEHHLGTQQVVEVNVAHFLGNAAVFEQQHRLHAQAAAAGSREHGMVGLGAAGGHHNGCTLILGIRQQKLQLAHLVAAEANTCHIIPLEIKALSEHPAQIGKRHQRRGKASQRNPWKI